MVSRIQIDWDHPSRAPWEQEILTDPRIKAAEWRNSANGRIHYRIHLHHPIPFQESITIRSELGDDATRIHADQVRHQAGARSTDTLYDRKGDKDAGEWNPIKPIETSI